MRKRILTVTLNPALDKIVRPAFTGHPAVFSAGGKGVNVSRTLGCLGRLSVASGLCGGDSGRKFLHLLEGEGMAHRFLKISGATRTNTTFVGFPAPSKRILQPGVHVSRREYNQYFRLYRQLLSRSRWVVISGRPALGDDGRLVARLIRIAQRAYQIPVTLDTSAAALANGIKAKPFMIKPNLEEAQGLLGRRLSSRSKQIEALKDLRRLGVTIVIISLAGKGALASDGKKVFFVSGKKHSGHGVGCGDAFVAGFIDAYLRRSSFATALKWAAACGEANMADDIPGAVKRKKVEKIFRRVQIQVLM